MICYYVLLICFAGAFGVDFADLNEDNVADGISQVSKALLQFGVTAYVPTIVTSSPEYYMKVLPLMTPREGGPKGAAVLGVHCEGPFINPQKKGAHTEEFIKPSVNHALLQSMYGSQLENIAILTLAPELEGSLDTIEWLRENKKDLVISIGHSMANLKQAEQAVRKGASLITHLFNAMLPVSVYYCSNLDYSRSTTLLKPHIHSSRCVVSV